MQSDYDIKKRIVSGEKGRACSMAVLWSSSMNNPSLGGGEKVSDIHPASRICTALGGLRLELKMGHVYV